MANSTKPPRFLLWATFLILFVTSSAVYFSRSQLPESIPINIKGQPTIGYSKARVHVVIFEEPKCSHCGEFTNYIFPILKKEFIDTSKITYTVIPVSFLPGSMDAAIATLCVYHENPLYPNEDLFFKYLDYIYRNQSMKADWATPQVLVQFAQATSPAIQIDKLKKGIEKEAYRLQIEENTAYGQQIMGGTISTPTIYVNGIKAQDISLDGMRKLIKEVLEHEGIY